MNQKEFNEVVVGRTDHCKFMLIAKGAVSQPEDVCKLPLGF